MRVIHPGSEGTGSCLYLVYAAERVPGKKTGRVNIYRADSEPKGIHCFLVAPDSGATDTATVLITLAVVKTVTGAPASRARSARGDRGVGER